MRKSIWIFLLAVLLPSLVLGWLALRSAQEQQIILEKRTAELYQTETETVAAAARALIEEQRRAFTEIVRTLLASHGPQRLSGEFASTLPAHWPRKAVGFAIGREGRLLSPSPARARENAQWQEFLLGNSEFLCSTVPASVYWVSPEELNRPEQARKKGGYETQDKFVTLTKQQAMPAPAASDEAAKERAAVRAKVAAPLPPTKSEAVGNASREAQPQASAEIDKVAELAESATRQELVTRNVAPQRTFEESGRALSQIVPATADFKALTSDTNEGIITRFVQDRLDIIFWLRPAQASELIFGCLIESDSLSDLWPAALPDATSSSRESAPEFVLALLDDKTRPVATQPRGEKARDWKRPFVASEIGEALPHWEAALYLQRPEQLQKSAHRLRLTLLCLIGASLGAIACGGWLVVADARRQLALAQKKTDFVSNVSHELKTPLTSIRMFAELMQNGRAETAAKHPQYLRIIMVEAERLTRLINNVLDFARLERRQKPFDKKPLDLHAVLARLWEGHELHLRESGFTTWWQAAPPPYPIVGDEDAIAQILVNLLSNAEKYAGERKEVELHSFMDGENVCVSVLDRGSGIPAGEERKIFEAFYRAHDSLSSGIQGSGLGLTLAQRLAREHGGEVRYRTRAGGGSDFTLCLPRGRVES